MGVVKLENNFENSTPLMHYTLVGGYVFLCQGEREEASGANNKGWNMLSVQGLPTSMEEKQPGIKQQSNEGMQVTQAAA